MIFVESVKKNINVRRPIVAYFSDNDFTHRTKLSQGYRLTVRTEPTRSK